MHVDTIGVCELFTNLQYCTMCMHMIVAHRPPGSHDGHVRSVIYPKASINHANV
jgi:hypothetical protein